MKSKHQSSELKYCCRKATRMFMSNCKQVIDSPSNIYQILLCACEAGCVWNTCIVHWSRNIPSDWRVCFYGVTGTGVEIILKRNRFNRISAIAVTNQNSFIILNTAWLYILICIKSLSYNFSEFKRYSTEMSAAALSEFLRGLSVDKEGVINKASRGMLWVIFRPKVWFIWFIKLKIDPIF